MLLIEWSASGVRVFDPQQRHSTYGKTLRECLGGSASVRDAVVAVSSRSAFIRTVQVPSVSRDEMHRLIALKLVSLLPFHPGEYVFGFRAGSHKQAIVGAVKTDLLREILSQTKELGIRVQTIVPLAFGSWIAAKNHGIADGAVVEQEGEFLSIDVISGGELRYSRSMPVPDSSEAITSEITRTFSMAEVPEGPVLSIGIPLSGASQMEPRQTIEFLADQGLIERHLFSLELPEVLTARKRRSGNIAMQRAILASIAAVALGAYEYTVRTTEQKLAARQASENARRIAAARREQAGVLAEQSDAAARGNLVQVAFHPAQTFSDVVSVLGGVKPRKLWLNGLTLEKGRPLVIRGIATSGKELADYMDDISTGDRFRSLRVLSANNGAIGKKPIVQFAVTGWIVGNLPIDPNLQKGAER